MNTTVVCTQHNTTYFISLYAEQTQHSPTQYIIVCKLQSSHNVVSFIYVNEKRVQYKNYRRQKEYYVLYCAANVHVECAPQRIYCLDYFMHKFQAPPGPPPLTAFHEIIIRNLPKITEIRKNKTKQFVCINKNILFK